MKEEYINRFYYECDCSCGTLDFSQWKDDGVAFISYNIPAFNAYQDGTLDNIKRRAKIIWNVLLGREHRFYEIVIEDNKKLNEFKEFVKNMREIDETK